eukprot:10655918-Alexandrium_andersonii.AAC.1
MSSGSACCSRHSGSKRDFTCDLNAQIVHMYERMWHMWLKRSGGWVRSSCLGMAVVEKRESQVRNKLTCPHIVQTVVLAVHCVGS